MGPRHPFHPHARRRRAFTATFAIVLCVSALVAAFFRTQVLQSEEYVLRSRENRLRVIPIPAPRGTIYDRNGEPVAMTVAVYTLRLLPTAEDSVRLALSRLAPVLSLDSARIAALIARAREEPREPLLVTEQLDFEQISWIQEHRADLPKISVEALPVRRYPAGSAVAHIVGYTGEISASELSDSAWNGYREGQTIGKAGLERQYERLLGGQAGERYAEVDARGHIVRNMSETAVLPPIPGQDIHLAVDLELQRFTHAIFPRGMRGALVAIVPSTGEVLALYSHPTYDPNELAGRIDPKVWAALVRDPGRPLLNRAIAGIYPPASTWKLATAIIGLETGAITADARMPIPCTGGMSYAGRYARCWRAEGHGSLDLAGAIAHSCNVYFYQLGIMLGLNQLTREGTRLGFGRTTRLDLPNEKSGIFPSGKEWYRKRTGHIPPPSEVMNLAIGQGPNSQTPLRMTQFFSAMAGNGTAPAPHLLARTERLPPETDLRLKPQTLQAVRGGLARVVEPGGTAYRSSLKNWKLYGKTGTAQNSQDAKRPHAWFAGFAGPANGVPEIAVAVVLEFGEHGSDVAPLAAKVADFYLNKKHDLPTARLQTLGERGSGEAIGNWSADSAAKPVSSRR